MNERTRLDHDHACPRCRPARRGRVDAGLCARHQPSRCTRAGRHRHDGAAPVVGRHGPSPLSAERAGLRSRRHRHRRQHAPARRHCGGNHLFAGKPIYVQRRELDDARSEDNYTIREWLEHPACSTCRSTASSSCSGVRLVPAPGHTRHAGGRRGDWRAPGRHRRRRGGLARRVRRAAHRRVGCGCLRSSLSWSGSRRARAVATPHSLRAWRPGHFEPATASFSQTAIPRLAAVAFANEREANDCSSLPRRRRSGGLAGPFLRRARLFPRRIVRGSSKVCGRDRRGMRTRVGHFPDVDLRPEGVTVRTASGEYGALSQRDVELARGSRPRLARCRSSRTPPRSR